MKVGLLIREKIEKRRGQGSLGRQIDRWVDRQIDRWVDRQRDRWVDRWMSRQMDRQIDGWIDGQIDRCRDDCNKYRVNMIFCKHEVRCTYPSLTLPPNPFLQVLPALSNLSFQLLLYQSYHPFLMNHPKFPTFFYSSVPLPILTKPPPPKFTVWN